MVVLHFKVVPTFPAAAARAMLPVPPALIVMAAIPIGDCHILAAALPLGKGGWPVGTPHSYLVSLVTSISASRLIIARYSLLVDAWI